MGHNETIHSMPSLEPAGDPQPLIDRRMALAEAMLNNFVLPHSVRVNVPGTEGYTPSSSQGTEPVADIELPDTQYERVGL